MPNFFHSDNFKYIRGDFSVVGIFKTTNIPITEADANDPDAVLDRGLMVDAIESTKELALTTGRARGILGTKLSLAGATSVQAYYDISIGVKDIPAKKGQAVSLIVPAPGMIAEFEGVGAAAVGNLVITATTTGFLAANTEANTELSVQKGGWRKAAAGETVVAKLLAANLTPVTENSLRILVEFVSPYKLVVDTDT